MARKSVEIFIRGYNKANKAFMDVQKTSIRVFASMRTGLRAVGLASAAAAAAFGAFAIKGTRDFARFGEGIAAVSTMIRTNVKENTAMLATGVRAMALEIPQSVDRLNVALYDLLSASVPVGESLAILKQAGQAAVAGLSDVQTASNLATGTINALGLAFSDSQRVFDLAFSTVRSGKVTFSELAGAMGQLLPSASKMNASVEEVYGSIAFLTKNAMGADMASVSLARAFDALGEKSAALEKLGIRVFGSEGEFRGTINVMQDIANSLAGMTDEAKVAKLELMGFEKRAARAVIVMADNIDAYRSTMDEVMDSSGAMITAYDKMKDTLTNQWKLLANSIRELGMTIGESLAGGASTAMKSIKAFVDGISKFIKRGGGLNKLWKAHGELVIAVIKDLAMIGLRLIGQMMKAMADIISAAAAVMWQPLAHRFKGVWDEVIHHLKLAWQGAYRGTEASEAKLAAAETARTEKVAAETIQHQKDMEYAFTHLAAIGVESFDKIVNAGTTGMKEAKQAIEEATLALGKFDEELEKPETEAAAPGIPEVVPERAAAPLAKILKDQSKAARNAAKKARDLEKEQAAEIIRIRQEVAVENLRIADKEYEARRLEIAHEASAMIQELGNTTEARKVANEWATAQVKQAINDRLDAEKKAAEEAVAIEKRKAKRIAQIGAERLAQVQALNSEIFAADEQLLMQMESLKQSEFDIEQDRILSLADAYNDYVNSAITMSNILFNAQEKGWLRTMAALIRYATKHKAAQLEAEGLEKLKQAAEAETTAQWLLAHSSKMAAIAAEAEAMANFYIAQAMMGDPRAAAAAAAMERVAQLAGAKAAIAKGQATAYQAQAKALQAQGAVLIKTATTVEASGKIVAHGLEMAADRADQLARKEEERQRQLATAPEYTGVGVVGPPAPIILPGAAEERAPRNIIYQNNEFNAMIDTAKQEDLRQQAEELIPYIDEVRARSVA